MSAQGTYPIGSRTLSASDTVTGVVTGATADVPLSMLANFASLNSSFAYAVEKQTASIGQTVFTLGSPYSNGVAGALAVYADGLRMVKDVDYTETNSTTVTFTSAVTYDYEVVFVIGGEVGIPPVSIVSVTLTSGTHAPGTLDTYTITFSDASTTNFQVYNGADYPVDGSGAFSTLSASGAVSGAGFLALFASPPPIGSVAAGSGAFTTLSASGAVSGAGFSNYFASPPALGSTAPAAGTFTTVTSTGNAALGDAEATDTHAIKGATTLLANSASAALTVTQTGAGNAFVVEDSASTDSTPFVINSGGRTLIGAGVGYTGVFNSAFLQLHNVGGNTAQSIQRYSADVFSPDIDFCKSRNATTGSHTIVQSGDDLGTLRFAGSDGTNFIQGASIFAEVDGTPGTNDMPGRLVFSTTADGASSPTERMRIDSSGNVGIGAAVPATTKLYVVSTASAASTGEFGGYYQLTAGNTTGAATKIALTGLSTSAAGNTANFLTGVQGDAQQNAAIATTTLTGVSGRAYTLAAGTITNMVGVSSLIANAGAATVTNAFGYYIVDVAAGASNYGYYSGVTAGANKYSFYAAGTAANYFAGDIQLGKTVTAGGVTGAQTINKTVGTVNFAAAATSLVVTNSLVTANSIITATVGTNDTTMKSVAVVAAAGSFTLHANAAATAETRVNFCVFN